MKGIKPGDRVLEIGSGNRPRKQSTILCDRFVESNYERAGGENLVIDARPFVVADGHHLPFKDHAFDYVITSHILEHVEDPVRFAAELTRVARAGYIETPSELGEKLLGWPFHKWIVHGEEDALHLRPRTSDSPFGDYFHRKYAADPYFAEFVDSNFTDFYVQYEWKGTIKLVVDTDPTPSVQFNSGVLPVETRSLSGRAMIALLTATLSPLMKLVRHFRKFEQ